MPETPGYGESFEALVTTYQGRLFSYALHLLRNREDAEEAVQDALMKAYLAWPRFKAKHRTSLSAWLLRITLNVARNRLRRKRVAQISVDRWSDSCHVALTDRTTSETVFEEKMTVDLVEDAIRDLPLHLFETARSRFIEGLTTNEIARRCSLPVGTVKSNIFRAKRLLRRALQPVLQAA